MCSNVYCIFRGILADFFKLKVFNIWILELLVKLIVIICVFHFYPYKLINLTLYQTFYSAKKEMSDKSISVSDSLIDDSATVLSESRR